MHKINLDAIDVDGAVREAADAVAGDTRFDFLKKAGLGSGAVLSGGAVLSAFAADTAFAVGKAPKLSRPPSLFGKGDIGILNYALTLEYLEAAFYTEALASGAIKDPIVVDFLKVVEKDERTHVSYLTKQIPASKRAKKPKFDFGGANKDEEMFKATAQVLENTGVGAYFGQGFNIKDPKTLAKAVSILTIEARHAGAIGLINGGLKNIAPDGPFDHPVGGKETYKAVVATGFIAS